MDILTEQSWVDNDGDFSDISRKAQHKPLLTRTRHYLS